MRLSKREDLGVHLSILPIANQSSFRRPYCSHLHAPAEYNPVFSLGNAIQPSSPAQALTLPSFLSLKWELFKSMNYI